jgi:hypothetical protein
VWQRFKGISGIDWALIVANSVLLIYTAGIGVQIRAYLQRDKEQIFQSNIGESNAATEQLIPADGPQLASHQDSKISSILPPS